ncbi:MAG: flagellar biosynthesis anti-sigma factor FlgM [bacterium]
MLRSVVSSTTCSHTNCATLGQAEGFVMAMNNIDRPSHVQPGILEQFQKSAGKTRRQNETGSPDDGTLNVGPGSAPADRAEISENARKLEDLSTLHKAGQRAMESVPDVRQDRIAQARERLESGYYNSDEVRQDVAGRLGAVLKKLETLLD